MFVPTTEKWERSLAVLSKIASRAWKINSICKNEKRVNICQHQVGLETISWVNSYPRCQAFHCQFCSQPAHTVPHRNIKATDALLRFQASSPHPAAWKFQHTPPKSLCILHDIKMRQKTRILGIVQVGFGVARRCFLMDAHRFPILESRFRIEKSSKICCSGGNSDLGAKNHQNCANLHWNTSIYSVLHFWHSSLRNLTLIIWKMRAGFN